MNEKIRLSKKAACSVCGYKFTEWASEVITCPTCHTSYDLVNRKVDRSQTMVSAMDCKHHRRRLICGSRWMGDNGHGHYDVMLCPDCGEFEVHGDQNGEYYSFIFDLPSDELVEAAGKYARYLAVEENGGAS